jgi:hypothetical protein
LAGIDTTTLTIIVNVAYVGVFILMFGYGQKIQLSVMQRSVRGKVVKLDQMQMTARSKFIDSLKKYSSPTTESTGKPKLDPVVVSADRLINSFIISPVSLDPNGIIPKLDHLLDSADENLKSDVRRIAVKASGTEVETLSNVAEITIGLNNLFKVARHFYLLGNKPGGALSIVQLQMLLPQVMEAAEAYSAAMDAFSNSKTIGDGFGPLVASSFLSGAAGTDSDKLWVETVKDTAVAKIPFDNRTAYVVKAKGPGGNVGKPGEAIQKILEDDPNVKCVITVDAAVKLEGEETGSLAEGVGAAIGGPGVDRYKIEGTTTSKQVELLALVTKMSDKEAITEISKPVKDKVPVIVERIKAKIGELPEGSSVVVAGIGNTLGVA